MTTTRNRTAIVTGGAGGLGAACAERLARDGFGIAIVDVAPADAVIARITPSGAKARAYRCDITDPAKVAALMKQIDLELGGCDVLVNNAGVYDFTPTGTITPEIWRRILSLNMDGMFYMSQAAAAGMQTRGWGRIVNIASNSCFAPPPGLTAYAASKMGVIGYARSLAGELGSFGITVNCVAPGPTITDQLRRSFAKDSGNDDPAAFEEFMAEFSRAQAIPRPGSPEDVADVVSFFASDDSRFVTGQTLVVDGGQVKH